MFIERLVAIRNHWHMYWQRYFAVMVAGVCIAIAGRGVHGSMQVRALQAEAEIMLSYLATLQAARLVDEGKYSYFAEFYGAPSDGVSRCERPAGAKELGFLVSNCDEDWQAGGARYAYRVLSVPGNPRAFRGEAVSGSGADKISFVCSKSAFHDVWSVDATKTLKHEKNCE